jgi:GNAT superfamily N-acetyltransferase
MNGAPNEIEIMEGYERTAPFLDELQEAADQHRTALGFFARSVYEELARGGYLYIATNRKARQSLYAGHLLFSCHFPRAHVLQLFTRQQYRRQRIGVRLLQRLKETLTRQGFISIYARVAEDLSDANAFWQRHEFYVQRVEEGGTSRNRKIIVRSHELPSPQLFPTSGISSANPLELSISTSPEIPLFLLDLNVLFDVMPRRLRHDEAASLFQAERMNSCRLAISNEIREELKRTAHPGRTDPMAAYISIFPSFPLADDEKSRDLLTDLAALVFPGRALVDKEKSDLRHLATAVAHNLAGFITNDGAVLTASSAIQARYGLRIISPAAFKVDGSPRAHSQFDVSKDATLELKSVRADEESRIRAFLSKLNLSGSAISSAWMPAGAQGRVASCLGVWRADIPVGYLTWTTNLPGSDTTVARIAVDEATTEAPSASRILLMHLLEQAVPAAPLNIRLEMPAHQSILREVAARLGFRGSLGGQQLTKLILGRVVTPQTWNTVRDELASKGGIKLPANIPSFRNIDQQMQVLTPSGNQVHVDLDSLETLLSPTLFCLPGRPAVITPVQRRFSEALLGHSNQRTLLPRGTASTYQERHYLSNPRTLESFRRGTLILFYESARQGGRGELVAIARVRQAYLRPESDLVGDLKQSVLTETSLRDIGSSEIKTVTVFDNIFHLPRGVPLTKLERLGCGRPNDLISTNSITDAQLQNILREAFDHE